MWVLALIITVAGSRLKFSSMSESTQTLQADMFDVKRCSCVVFFPKTTEKRLDKQALESTPSLPLCARMMLKES